ncbi:MAG: patatin-like phospholipase family protein [Candidatus Absconditabacterales bacterium]
MKLFSFLHPKKKYTLVISGGGTRGFYALGILKGLEKLGYKDKIEAIYGVSAGAIVGSYRAAGYSAQEIYDIFFDKRSFGISSINIFSKKSLLKLNYFEKRFTQNLPKKITDLKIKTYIGTTDVKTGKFLLFDEGDLIPILLGSMSIPGIFPVIHYQNHILMDGGATNNFPVDLAKQRYPKNKIIGIALNKFQENQKIKSIFDNLSVSFEILLRHHTVENMGFVEHLFYKDLSLKVLDIKKKNMHKAYLQGYEDCIEHFN